MGSNNDRLAVFSHRWLYDAQQKQSDSLGHGADDQDGFASCTAAIEYRSLLIGRVKGGAVVVEALRELGEPGKH